MREEVVLAFRANSSDDRYGPGRQGALDLRDDDDIICRFAHWSPIEYATALLNLAGCGGLVEAIAARRREV